VSLFPWAAQLFTIQDSVNYTATPMFELWGPTDNLGHTGLLKTVTCTIVPGTASTCSSVADTGSYQTSDPFLETTL